MSVSIKNKYLFGGILVVFLALFGLGWYLGQKKTNNASMVVQNALKQQLSTITIQLNDVEYSLTKSEQIVATQKELVKQGELNRKELKTLNLKQANEISKLKFRIDTLLEDVGHTGQVIVIHDTVTGQPKNCMLLPFTFGRTDEWLDLRGDFNSKGALNISLKMQMAVDVITGYERKTKTPSISILTTNPYIQTVGINSWKTDTPKSQRYGIGAQLGYGFNLKTGILSPYIGVGVHYSLIRF
jgi:hypothetical protein